MAQDSTVSDESRIESEIVRAERLVCMKEQLVRGLAGHEGRGETLKVCLQIVALREYLRILKTKAGKMVNLPPENHPGEGLKP